MPFLKPLHNPKVGCGENPWPLDAHADQRVDVEEAAIAKLLVGGSPIRQSIVLQIEQRIERVDVCVQLIHCARNRARHLRLFVGGTLQKLVENGFVAMARG